MKTLLVTLLFALLPAGISAQSAAPGASTDVAETQLDRDVRAVSAQLRCPVCQGLSLQDSPSELSQEMKDVVRQQLAEGRTPEEVKAYFVSKYGEWILMEPKPEGFNLAVYALPIIGLIAGAAFVFFTARRWVRQGGDAELAEEAAAEEEARARLA